MKLLIERDGDKFWYLNGKLHREDGPAIEWGSGEFEWFYEGENHREAGPAIANHFSREWYLNGQLHREDGPAIEWFDGEKWWYLYDVQYTEEEFKRKIELMNLTKELDNELRVNNSLEKKVKV